MSLFGKHTAGSACIGSVLLLFFIQGSYAQILINEICASNVNLLADSYGDLPDWIEILNAGTDTLDLSQYCLSDDSTERRKWCFPAYDLLPGEHLLVFASGKDLTDLPLFWETLIKQGDHWRYILPDPSTAADWNMPGFDDSSWSGGPTGIGYSDGDDATEIPSTLSVFMRKSFSIEDSSRIRSAVLHMDYDDGFVAYLNGIEIARDGVSGSPPEYNTLANPGREALMYSGGSPARFDLPDSAGLFRQGENILAIQVHNVSASSSDLSAIPFLSVLTIYNPGISPPGILNLSPTRFHTNFKLNVDGEWLYLSRLEGIPVDSVHIPCMGMNLSFGRRENSPDEWVMFQTPTPGQSNSTSCFQGYITRTPEFSQSGGRFFDSITVSLSSPEPDDTIYYTTDGSEPSSSAFIYREPIEITTDTIIRARILKTGFVPGKTISRTFFPGEDNPLPVVCISTDPFNLWDENFGMYVPGPNAEAEFPHFNANFWRDWEKPAHVELYEKDGSLAFGLDAGIQIYGGWSRGFPQKSLAIFARKKYGEGKIHYPIFRDKPIYDFEAIVLRNSGNDWVGRDVWGGTLFRDILMTRLTGDMEVEHMASRQVVVYINGEYWGVMNLREKINEHFIASNGGVDPHGVDFLENRNHIIQGSNQHYLNMLDFLETNDIQQEENYEWVETRMDIQNFINYQLAQIFYDNRDWPGNNIKYWRPATPRGKWRWIMFDTDFGFGLWNPAKVWDNTLLFAMEKNFPDWPNPPWSTYLFRRLLENQAFKEKFINSFADRINTNFRSDSVIGLINALESNIAGEMNRHFDLWGDPPPEGWQYQVEQLRYFARNRPGAVRDHIRRTFGLNWNMHTVKLTVSDEATGYVRLNSIFIRKFPWEGSYFESIPVELTAITRPGFRFAGWTGSIESRSPHIRMALFEKTSLRANFEPDPIPFLSPVVINEIFYQPDSVAGMGDWIELYNNSDQYLDISGWIIKDSDEAHAYSIAPGTILGPRDYLVICRDAEAFGMLFPEVNNYKGDLDFGFSSTGDMVRLYDADSLLVDSVLYGIFNPWPYIPPGSGLTLALKDPYLENNMAASWSLSSEPLGTPGSANLIDPGLGRQQIKTSGDILYQNSPNPFSGTTRVIFYSSRTQPVRLAVYDLNGRLVEVLADREFREGRHEFDWTPGISGPGVFILRAETPQSVYTRKMLRLR